MGTIYRRKNKLWMGYKDVDGHWRYEATKYGPDQRSLARKTLQAVERRVEAELGLGITQAGPPTLRSYAERWIRERRAQGIASADDEEARLRLHIHPVLGAVLLRELRPRHVRDLLRQLRRKNSARGDVLAPRTVRHCYAILHRLLHDAVVDELIDANPCVLKRGELPGKVDRDPTWRMNAIFTREEVEQVISDERVPADRRIAYALLLLGGLRFGEVAALRWRFYDPTIEPLGRLVVAFSYDTKRRREKGTKADRPRQVPVHATLAKVLAAWKLAGWSQVIGRAPEPDDLIIPSRIGRHRNVNHMLRRFHEDLDRLGLRRRRQHDLRRTFISLCLADGARKDVLRWITHGPSGDIMDLYTTLPWFTLCAEVAKLNVAFCEGTLVQFVSLSTDAA